MCLQGKEHVRTSGTRGREYDLSILTELRGSENPRGHAVDDPTSHVHDPPAKGHGQSDLDPLFRLPRRHIYLDSLGFTVQCTSRVESTEHFVLFDPPLPQPIVKDLLLFSVGVGSFRYGRTDFEGFGIGERGRGVDGAEGE